MSKMQPSPEQNGEGSRIAIVFNGSPLFTGDAGSGESNIRRWIIENDRLEAVIALPNQMFYNTGIFTYIWIVSNRKPKERQGKVQLINAVDFFVKMKKSLGDKRNEIGDGEDGKPNHIAQITQLYSDFNAHQHSKIFNNREFGYLKITVERPLRLSFYLTPDRLKNFKYSAYFESLAVSKKRKDKEAIATEQAQGLTNQEQLLALLEPLLNNRYFDDREDFFQLMKTTLEPEFKLDAALKTALVGAFGEKDPSAQTCKDSKGNPEPDAELRDTENVPLPDSIALPLPLDYEGKDNKGKVDKTDLLALVQTHCEAYLAREVLPYRSDAWIDHSKVKVGFEIPLNRHFYQYQPPRELSAIETDIKGLEAQIMEMLREVV
jgi:type I restriction enzyme M protein